MTPSAVVHHTAAAVAAVAVQYLVDTFVVELVEVNQGEEEELQQVVAFVLHFGQMNPVTMALPCQLQELFHHFVRVQCQKGLECLALQA